MRGGFIHYGHALAWPFTRGRVFPVTWRCRWRLTTGGPAFMA
ncbi:hypothetical protein SXCC_03130 [Gluconacetobacter sp. SXCC-1]|nr:hypothetical protein SXCC_03130 [Gluconacetobacter sp. SXCC-1]